MNEYLDEVPVGRAIALRTLRALCTELLVGFTEEMRYGLPGYARDGVIEVGFASQKNNIALYILRTDVLNVHRKSFAASAIGKGCIRYRNPASIDFAVVKEMLRATSASRGPVC